MGALNSISRRTLAFVKKKLGRSSGKLWQYRGVSVAPTAHLLENGQNKDSAALHPMSQLK
jgi:hypothetical protein